MQDVERRSLCREGSERFHKIDMVVALGVRRPPAVVYGSLSRKRRTCRCCMHIQCSER